MPVRNRHLAQQLRASLRRSRWDAGVIAFRACVSRQLMARLLMGETDIPMRVYELVAEQLELSLTLEPFLPAVRTAPGPVASFVDVVRERLHAGHCASRSIQQVE